MLFEVDNNTVVSALRSGSGLDTQVMRLLRLLHFVAAERRFSLHRSTFRDQKCNGVRHFYELSAASLLCAASSGIEFRVNTARTQEYAAGRSPRLDIRDSKTSVSRLFSQV